ncbi:O-antigen ligase family protein [Aliarcobacter trophiarum]|uniref:O-antigen ligase family protein n=1 Tax=Aliarcobacter trophiarum TaxID=708186 RepID=UPI00100A3F66|nr:O-antigen ligase family protein [Aliarcobacter trophiarum]RXI28668.1 hypothetical protein CRU89_01555 [Aliarcobacter trophiarum]
MIKYSIFNDKYNYIKNNATLYGNHLLVVYAFVSPMYNRSVSAVIFLLLLLFIIRGDYKKYLLEAFSNKIIQALVFFVLVNYIWLIGSDDEEMADIILSNMKYYLYPILILSFVDKKFAFRIIYAFIIGMLVSEFISYMIYFDIFPHKLELFSKIIYEIQEIGNPTPFLDHYFYNTLLSIVVSILLYNLLVNKNSIYMKFISIFFITTASINIILIGGRIGYVIYAILILSTLFFIYKKKFFYMALPMAIVLISSFFYFSYQNGGLFKDRIDQAFNDKVKLMQEKPNYDTSIGARIGMWIYSIDVIKDNFLFGVGTGDFKVEMLEKTPEEHKFLSKYQQPHNEYIKHFVQFGIIGFIVFLNIFYQIFRTKNDNKDMEIYLYIFGIALMFMITTNQLLKPILLVFILLLSVASVKTEFLEEKYLKLDKKILFFYLIASIIAILIDIAQR